MTDFKQVVLFSVGYSDELAGGTCTVVILVGAAGTVLLGVIAERTGKIVEITKLCCFGAIVCVLAMSYLLLLPDVGVYILIAGGFLGLFALGVFPLALEVTVEATFPADQATVTCFIFFSSSVQGVFLMVVENWLGYPLPDKYKDIEKCTLKGEDAVEVGAGEHLVPKDYTYYLLFVTVYLLVLILIYMFFFKTELRRTLAGNLNKAVTTAAPGEGDKDVQESLLPGGMNMVRVVSRKRLITC